jgi:hypothetical protein
MKALQRVTVTMLAGLALAACARLPETVPSQPWVGPDGRVVQPPQGGWPMYDRGGGADVGGGGRS